MSRSSGASGGWSQVRALLAAEPAFQGLRVPRGPLPHPRDAGARSSTTWPVGQLADFVLGEGDAALAIREFPEHWEAFVPGRERRVAMPGVLEASESAMYFRGGLLGATVGAAVCNKPEGVVLGAGLGVLFAALIHAAVEERRTQGSRTNALRKRRGGRSK